ncbi:MAG: GNAT family N-acetyltransferase [Trichodesmium sp. MAG_R04]|nr:GNAT family N-acetyltransferase [Trichodesmium sp. MAG_R04]
MFKINSRKLTQQEAILLVENIKLITEITGYSLKEWLTFEDVLIAEDQEENMLGVCLAYDFSSNWSFISVLFVLEKFRGKGIGQLLFKEACRQILSRKRNVYTSSRNPVVIKMMKQLNFILFDTLYVLPQPFNKYKFDFLLRGIKWITSFYRMKELSRKYLKYKDKRKFVYGIKSYE